MQPARRLLRDAKPPRTHLAVVRGLVLRADRAEVATFHLLLSALRLAVDDGLPPLVLAALQHATETGRMIYIRGAYTVIAGRRNHRLSHRDHRRSLSSMEERDAAIIQKLHEGEKLCIRGGTERRNQGIDRESGHL